MNLIGFNTAEVSVSGPHSEELPWTPVDPGWVRRFNAKMADLAAARAKRATRRDEEPEGVER